MSDPNFWSIVSVASAFAATLIGALLALLAYGHHRQQAIRFWEREQRLPDATRLANLNVQIEELKEEYKTLKDNIFDAQQTIEAAENQRQWMEDANEEVARLQDEKREVERIQRELETAQVQLASLNEVKASLDGEIANGRTHLEGLDEKQRTLTRELEALKRELERVSELTKEIAALEERKKTAKHDAEQLEQAAMRALNDLKRCREESEAETEKLQKSLDRLKSENTDLEKERRMLASAVAELEAKSNALNAQIPTLQTTFENLSSAVAQHDGAANPEENEIWQPVLPVIEASRQESRSEQERLSGLASSLETLGLKFDRRILYAFHTSLKTTDSSPLVTLAGVSGTGKSELPRRYAEAIGMNFLNVAVQPRWDSPQDLFGFHDYLERRFRPTDLTRALIQMDSIGDQKGRGWNAPTGYGKHRMPNQLLLVLLDEMNLARIEYYFSEFLSRLETRRGVDPNNAQRRKLAEISLDVEGRRSGQPPMQLFVNKNVLFVGTMNEDETTQALSDKVIDRANVLRFGSPNSIVPVPASQRNGRSVDTVGQPRLPLQTWQKWCKTADNLADDERNTLLDYISELRGSMDHVNRPFAYRVAHSMLEYAANYPAVERRLDFVVADQIEQKILPKLMGLNPRDPSVQRVFATIERILDRVDDEALKSRIDVCRKDDYFQWTGIDRAEV